MVTKEVLEGILAVKDSGLTNMFVISEVSRLAQGMGYKDTHAWLENPANRKEYAHGLFYGLEVEGSGSK